MVGHGQSGTIARSSVEATSHSIDSINKVLSRLSSSAMTSESDPVAQLRSKSVVFWYEKYLGRIGSETYNLYLKCIPDDTFLLLVRF
jgi:hypothetical protein